jgi:hypothetical protein
MLNNSQGWAASNVGANGVFYGDIGARFFRVRATAYTSGPIGVSVDYSAVPAPLGVTSINAAPALTKGTQPTTGFAVQDLKDSGRTAVVLSVTAVASVTAAALFTMNIWKNGAVSTGTSYTVTAGKTFRIQAIQFGVRFATPSTTVTFASARFDLRAIASGALSATSAALYGDTKMAVANAPTPNSDLNIPDGLELPSGYVFGMSHVDSATTLLLDALIVGYEY